jgi:opacity protein-like surface antigen
MRRAWPLVLLLGFVPRAAAAQAFEIAGGYAIAHDSRDAVTLPAGWMAGAAIDVSRIFSIVADLSGQYKTIALFNTDARLRVHTVMGGLRATGRLGVAREFAQVIAGLVQTSGSAFGETTTTRSFALQPGAGIDFPLTRAWAARAELDVRLIAAQPDGQTSTAQYRFVAGLVYRRRSR